MANMKIKGKVKGGELKCKVQAKHEMMTYNSAAKKLGDRDKANFITYITAKVGDKLVFEMSTSQFLSKNPIFKFKAKADGIKKGDKLTMTWTDRSGKTVSESKKIK